jgi:hypothetical protein
MTAMPACRARPRKSRTSSCTKSSRQRVAALPVTNEASLERGCQSRISRWAPPPATTATQRPGLKAVDDTAARKDAGGHSLHLVIAAHHEPVAPLHPVGLDIVAPVRLGVPVPAGIFHNITDAEIGVEIRDELVELHRRERSAAASDCRAFSTPSNRSPCCSTRPSATSIVKSRGSRSSVTSSQRSGVETGAPALGRTE